MQETKKTYFLNISLDSIILPRRKKRADFTGKHLESVPFLNELTLKQR